MLSSGLYGMVWNRRCGARTRSGHPCHRWAIPGKVRCKLHGGASIGPKFWDGKAEIARCTRRGRKRWVEWMRSQGLKFPCGRKRKGTQGPVLVGKALLAHKAMQATAARIRRTRTKLEIAQQLQDRLATEHAARVVAEKARLLGCPPSLETASPPDSIVEAPRGCDSDMPRAVDHTPNWDAVTKRAINAQFAERCHAQWIRNGGAAVDECGPMPRKQGVLDDPRMRRRLTAQDFTAGIKRC